MKNTTVSIKTVNPSDTETLRENAEGYSDAGISLTGNSLNTSPYVMGLIKSSDAECSNI